MFPVLFTILLALLALLPGLAPRAGSAVGLRSKLLDTVTTISATETDATAFDLRGMKDILFRVLATLNTGFTSGSVFFKCSIIGCNTETGTFLPIEGLATAELVVDVGQTIPSPTNAPNIVLPRWIKVVWTETGAMTSFTATCRMYYEMDETGPGKQYSSGYQSG